MSFNPFKAARTIKAIRKYAGIYKRLDDLIDNAGPVATEEVFEVKSGGGVVILEVKARRKRAI